jgi:diguanylate cyclase (GGDEF)-like protein/PAS domain S-box-containing protein
MDIIDVTAKRYGILDHAPIGQFILRRDHVVLFWNRCLEAWTGMPREKIVGSRILDHFPHLGAPKYASRIAEIFKGGPPTVFSSQLHRHIIPAPLPGGKFRFQYTVVTAVPGPDGESFDAMFAIQDVTSLTEAIENHRLALNQAMAETEERRKAEAKLVTHAKELERLNGILEERSIRDGLTGLYNHRYFYEILHRDYQLAERNDADIAVILLDLDHFKNINDTYGHPCGDYILKETAALLRQIVRRTDLVARYGGEEFAIILPDTDLEGARVTAEHVRHGIEKHVFRQEAASIRITASIGLAARQAHRTSSPEELVSGADKALYRAKSGGRNRITVFSAKKTFDSALAVGAGLR